MCSLLIAIDTERQMPLKLLMSKEPQKPRRPPTFCSRGERRPLVYGLPSKYPERECEHTYQDHSPGIVHGVLLLSLNIVQVGSIRAFSARPLTGMGKRETGYMFCVKNLGTAPTYRVSVDSTRD